MEPTRNRRHRGLVWLASGAAALGLGLGAASLASAATGTTTTPPATVTAADPSATPPADQPAPPADPASLPNGPGETLLTGDTLTKVTDAALAAQPGATVVRAETDTNGHTYEVHLQLADGSYSTLYFNESFEADGSDTGFGPGGPGGPGGHHGHHGGDHDGDRDGDQGGDVGTDNGSTPANLPVIDNSTSASDTTAG